MAKDVVALAIAFQQGLATRDDVGAWVDNEVTRVPVRPAVLELATLQKKNDLDILSLLDVLAADAGPRDAEGIFLGTVGLLLRTRRIGVGEALRRLHGRGEAVDLLEMKARAQPEGASIERELRELLEPYCGLAFEVE